MVSKEIQKSENIITGIFVVLFLITCVIYLFPSSAYDYVFSTNIIFLLHPAIGFIGGLFAVHAFGVHNKHGRSFLLMTLGLLFWFLGEFVWAMSLVVLHNPSPFPSIADVFYVLAYPLMLTGIFREIQYYQAKFKPLRNLPVVILSLFSVAIVFSIMIFPLYMSNESVLEKIISFSYGVADIFLIVGIAYVLMLIMNIHGGRLFRAWISILVASMFMLVADVLFSLYNTQYEQGILIYKQIDLLWVISYLSFAYGLLQMRFVIQDVQYKLKQLIE